MFYVIVKPGIAPGEGPFRSYDEAREYANRAGRAALEWVIIPVESPSLPVDMLTKRLQANPPEPEDH